jgi:signal transduction histidine kinase
MNRWRAFLLAKPQALVLAVVLAVLIGVVDALTTYEFAVSAFYLIPICWACWAVGRRAGFLLAVLSAVIWFIADYVDGHIYEKPVVPYWNAVMLLALFLAVVYSLSAFRDAHRNLLEAQARLENQNEWLEKTVRQRTSALQSEIAERKRLEQANLQTERLALVGTMAAEVAHEVRNPLGSIKLNLDLIAKQIENLADTSHHPPAEGRALVHEMREEVRRIQSVIDDYLQFARLRKPQRKPMVLNEFLEQKLAFMGSAFENAGVRLHTDFDARLKTINADGEQLWQAVLNLVRNSLEAMPGGGVLAISTQKRNGEAILSVADTGTGMSEEQLKGLFVPFFTTKRGGTGLGLPLTQQILSEHGAQIECASIAGKGTTFTIHFPLKNKS